MLLLLCFLISIIMLSIELLCSWKVTFDLVTGSTTWPKQFMASASPPGSEADTVDSIDIGVGESTSTTRPHFWTD